MPRFELAAYRKANPRGKITFAPLFVESTVVVLIVGGYLASALLQVLFVFQDVVRMVWASMRLKNRLGKRVGEPVLKQPCPGPFPSNGNQKEVVQTKVRKHKPARP